MGAAMCHQPNEYYASRPIPPSRPPGRALKLEVRDCVTACCKPF
jgi:hypothetical protein